MAATKLEAWPELRRWLERQRLAPPAPQLHADHFAWNVARALVCEENGSTEVLLSGLRRFLADATDPLAAFVDAIRIFEDCDADLLNVLGELAHVAVRAGRAGELAGLVSAAADLTGLVGLRFLAAWCRLNDGDLKTCVEECEKVDGAYSSVLTLQGQALLELGDAEEAVRVLEAAAKLGPRELLAWFQLAKACHVTGRTQEAWTALERCEEHAEGSPEVALFKVLVSLDEGATEEMRRDAFEAMRSRLASVDQPDHAVLHLLQLAGRLGEREAARELARSITGGAIRHDARQMKIVADVLRSYERLGWMDVSATLLQGLLAEQS